jgi:dephospho-CoA kinase
MLVVGLTGGIGSGKSMLAGLLAERGAQVIDADALGREALRPGKPAWHSVVSQFGEEILAAGSMEIDRKRLADIVFHDEERRIALNAIVHPRILRGIADDLDRLRNSDAIVVIDAALLVDVGLHDAVDVLLMVDADESLRRKRLVEKRGLSFDDISARMAVQSDPNDLAAMADIVVRNDGTAEDLADEAERVWADLIARREAKS